MAPFLVVCGPGHPRESGPHFPGTSSRRSPLSKKADSSPALHQLGDLGHGTWPLSFGHKAGEAVALLDWPTSVVWP